MPECSGEEKRREIARTVTRYQLNHWRTWLLPLSFIVAPFLGGAVGLGLALLVEPLLRRFGASEEVGLSVVLSLILLSLVGSACLPIWMDRHWPRGDPRVALPAASPRYLRYWKHREYFVLALCLLFGASFLRFAPRLQPLSFAVLLLLPDVLDTVVARRLGTLTPWQQRPVTLVLLGLYGLYALVVAAGMPQLGGSARCGISLRFGLVFALVLLNMVASSLYSRLQFRRLQHLVNEDPPEGGA